MIKLLCKNRQIIRTDNQWIIEYSRNVDEIFVKFDDEWNGYYISVTFRNGEIGPYTVDYKEGLKIPPQFLETGSIYLSFTGRKTDGAGDISVLRTGEMQHPIMCHKAGDAVTIPPPELPPSIWEQAIVKADEALVKATEALDIAEGIRADADKLLAAATKGPQIGENGNWFVWDLEKGEYVDTGVRAEAMASTIDHNELINRNLPDQHNIEAVTHLREELDEKTVSIIRRW